MHAAIYVSSSSYICVLTLLYMCPPTNICVRILYMCPHTAIRVESAAEKCSLSACCYHAAIYVSSYSYMCPHTTILLQICVLLLLYVCPHTTSWRQKRAECALACLCMLLYMCPPPTIYVSSYYYTSTEEGWVCAGVPVHAAIYVSSYYYICILILLY